MYVTVVIIFLRLYQNKKPFNVQVNNVKGQTIKNIYSYLFSKTRTSLISTCVASEKIPKHDRFLQKEDFIVRLICEWENCVGSLKFFRSERFVSFDCIFVEKLGKYCILS